PIDMIYSYHSERLYNGNEEIVDFAEALEAEADRKKGLRIPAMAANISNLFYRDLARYAAQVERYLNVFSREQIHIIIFDDFKKDVKGAYRSTLQFLDVNQDFQPNFRIYNPRKKVRSKAIGRILNNPPNLARAIGRRLMTAESRQKVKDYLRFLNTSYGTRSSMPDAL